MRLYASGTSVVLRIHVWSVGIDDPLFSIKSSTPTVFWVKYSANDIGLKKVFAMTSGRML